MGRRVSKLLGYLSRLLELQKEACRDWRYGEGQKPFDSAVKELCHEDERSLFPWKHKITGELLGDGWNSHVPVRSGRVEGEHKAVEAARTLADVIVGPKATDHLCHVESGDGYRELSGTATRANGTPVSYFLKDTFQKY